MKDALKRIFKNFGYEMKKIQTDDEISFLLKQSNNGQYKPVVFDIGANIGNYTKKLLSKNPDLSVYSFEPFKESFEKLSAATSSLSQVKAINLGLSDENGKAVFFTNEFSETNSLLPSATTGNNMLDGFLSNKGSVEITTATLDTFCAENNIGHIDLLKIDVQGAEYKVLKGAEGLFKEQKVKSIRVEVNFKKSYEGQSKFSQVLDLLQSYNFELVTLLDPVYLEGVLYWADPFFKLSKVK